MNMVLQALATVLLTFLSNENLHNTIIKAISQRIAKPDNAIDEEYTVAQDRSIRERLVENKVPTSGNIFLSPPELEQIKAARPLTPKQANASHEDVG